MLQKYQSVAGTTCLVCRKPLFRYVRPAASCTIETGSISQSSAFGSSRSHSSNCLVTDAVKPVLKHRVCAQLHQSRRAWDAVAEYREQIRTET